MDHETDDPLCGNCGHPQSMHSDGHGQYGTGPCDYEPGRGPGHQEYCECEMYEEDQRNQTKVQLGVAAWEWTCPSCQHYNRVADYLKPVTCEHCGYTFYNTEVVLPWG